MTGTLRRGGFVLLVVVALLGALAFLATEIASRSRQSRQLSLNALGLAKATLAARSGLEKGIQGMVTFGRQPCGAGGFESQLMSAGEDVNRNGLLDGGEDLDGDGRISIMPHDMELTPSLALRDPVTQRAVEADDGGLTRGVTWRNGPQSPDQLCSLRISAPSLDLNAGVEPGEGPEGQRFMAEQGYPYAASEFNHPFNIPFRRFLNSWGNYHKYLAMVRPDKTYNFDRSTDMGLIDSPLNLMGSDAEARRPSAGFDDFNPSGNFAATIFPTVPIPPEPPLGDLLLSSRPAGGFRTVEQVLPIVESYIHSWKDKAGRRADSASAPWRYADGSAIPVMTPGRVRAILDEFKDLACVDPVREKGWVFRRGQPSPQPPAEVAAEMVGQGGTPSPFEQYEARHHLLTKAYEVPALRVDVNRAPESVLAALVQAPGRVRLVAYNRYEKTLGIPENVFPRQCENNYPCVFNYSGPMTPPATLRAFIWGKPLFSMTESLRLAQDMVLERRGTLFENSHSYLHGFLRSWRKGYDAKDLVFYPDNQFNTVAWNLPPGNFDQVSKYYDLHHGHRRVQILSELLNPHLHDARVVWDEALPLAVENRKNRLSTANNPFPGRYFMFDETDGWSPETASTGSSAEKGPEACFQSPSFQFSCLGWCAPSGQRRHLSARIRIYEKAELSSQKDFEEAFSDPGTGASTLAYWVTYPELPGVSPSMLSGQVALRPILRQSPAGEELQLRVKLNGYEANPTLPFNTAGDNLTHAWPLGQRFISGGPNMSPNPTPARGIFRNSLQPKPTEPLTSLYPSSSAELDSATDLLPGGGIRMSPWSNSTMRGPFTTNWPNHREALLVLRNSLIDPVHDSRLPSETYDPGTGRHILPQFHEGAVSFYVKPRFHCEGYTPDLPPALPTPNGAATLFYMPFTVFDQETEARCRNMGLTDPEPKIRSQYAGSLRLVWWAHPRWSSGIQYDYVPAPNTRWPAVPSFPSNPPFQGQMAAGPHYFPSMSGRTDPANPTSRGHVFDGASPIFGLAAVPGGDNIEGHWRVPNPQANEVLLLEWEIHKFADHDDLSTLYSSPLSVTPRWGVWDGADALTPVAASTAYLNRVTTPLHLYDTVDSENTEYHSVRKGFYMERPVKWTISGVGDGTGPRDSRGDYQALIESGRWNHIFIAWKDLWSVLGNKPRSMGGSLAVYVNGSYRKASPMDHKTSAIFFNFDSSPVYLGSTSPGVNYSSWDALGFKHVHYQQNGFFVGPKTVVPWGGINFSKTYCIPASSSLELPLSPSGFDNPGPASEPLHPAGINFFNAVYKTIQSPRKSHLFRRFPPQFYFGFEPHTLVTTASPANADRFTYFPSNIAWASFMDIQIFSKVTQSGGDSPVDPSGEFLTALTTPLSPYRDMRDAIQTGLWPLLKQGSGSVLSEPAGLVGVSWSAYLPEFHQFHDDENALTPGPDSLDAQRLWMDIEVRSQAVGSLTISQRPSDPAVQQIELTAPVTIQGADDIKLLPGYAGPRATMSSPLIDAVELTFQRGRPKYEKFQLE